MQSLYLAQKCYTSEDAGPPDGWEYRYVCFLEIFAVVLTEYIVGIKNPPRVVHKNMIGVLMRVTLAGKNAGRAGQRMADIAPRKKNGLSRGAIFQKW